MRNFEHWLEALATEPLPGGVAAATLAAVMGAALVSKTVRITLDRQPLSDADRAALEETLQLAQVQQAELTRLANADEQAYRTVLRTRDLSDANPARREAWHAATEAPICIAEACWSLQNRLPGLLDACWPAVRNDLEVGSWLLQVGGRAGIQAAEANLHACGDSLVSQEHRVRVAALAAAVRPPRLH